MALLLTVGSLLSSGSPTSAQAAPQQPQPPWALTGRSAGLVARLTAQPRSAQQHPDLALTRSAASARLSSSSVFEPNAVALDPSTGTLYSGGGDEGDGKLDVLDARHCSPVQGGCPDRATLSDLGTPAAIAVDPGSGTVYVSGFGTHGVVGVVDGRHCNAGDVSGCQGPVGYIADSEQAFGLQIDSRTHTLYVGSENGVGVVDIRACNAGHPTGCSGTVARVASGFGSVFPLLDAKTETLYVPQNFYAQGGDRVAVVDASRCNATVTSGCGADPATFPVGTGALKAALDPSTHTLYVGSELSAVASVVDVRRCNASTTAGCPRKAPPAVAIGPNTLDLAVTPRTHTLYGLAAGAGVLAVVDVRHCRAGDTSRCDQHARTVQTGPDTRDLVLDPRTHLLFLAVHGEDAVQVVDTRACSAVRHGGCRREAPARPSTTTARVIGSTIYQGPAYGDRTTKTLTFAATRHCNVRDRSRCAPRASIDLGYAAGLAVDPSSDTLYLVDAHAGLVHLVDARTCNVNRRTGCTPFATFSVPSVGNLYLDHSSHTVYADQDDLSSVAVIAGLHCNGRDRTGCGRPVLEVQLGDTPGEIHVDQAGDTAYVALIDEGKLALLPSAACVQASSGCAVVTTTQITGFPLALAEAPGRHTLYATGSGNTNVLTLVDTATCNAQHTAGCASTWTTTPMPEVPYGILDDAVADRIVVTTSVSTVEVLDPRTCSVATPAGCNRSWPQIPVGFTPVYFDTSPRYNTLYTYNYDSRSQSLINLAHPCRSGLCVQPT